MADPATRPTNTVSPGKRHKRRELDPKRKPWYKQKGESAQAYGSFMQFLMLGPDRNLRGAAEATGKSLPMMQHWSRQWSWYLRAGAYEEHYMLLKLESVEAERDEMYREHKQLTASALSLVGKTFDTMHESLEKLMEESEEEMPLPMKIEAATKLMAEALKAQRLSVEHRAEFAAASAEAQERLTERYSDEMAGIMREFANMLNLTPEQEKIAQEAVTRLLVGDAEEEMETVGIPERANGRAGED